MSVAGASLLPINAMQREQHHTQSQTETFTTYSGPKVVLGHSFIVCLQHGMPCAGATASPVLASLFNIGLEAEDMGLAVYR